MATRENQGLQIALILFVMITVALAISTYVYFRKAEEKIAEAEAAQQATAQKEQAMQQALNQSEKLKEFIGWPLDAQVADIEAGYNADMTQFGADYPADEPKNYRTLPGYLMTALRNRQTQVADASVREKELDANVVQVEKRETDKTAKAEEALATVTEDRDAQRIAYQGDRKRFEGESEKLAGQIAEKGKQYTALIAENEAKLNAKDSLIEEEADRAKSLLVKLDDLTQTTFERADGQITFVDQVSGKVIIDVGLLDGVRPQTAFKVYPPGQNSYEVENSKGTIEVISILDKHRAEARIVSDITTDPILRGDYIFTPLWRPGTNVRFALAGMIDLDDDAQSDRSLIRSLITMNSGIVDAEVDETGKRSGKMSVNTRYLVVGQRPTEATDPKAIAGYTNMLTDAQNLGIEQITVDKLLDYLNYRGTERSVKLGKGANPKDFQAQPIDGVNRSSTGNNAFKQRRPPQPNKEGAF